MDLLKAVSPPSSVSMPASQPIKDGNNNVHDDENAPECRWGQVESPSIETGASSDNTIVTMLICTQPPATSVKISVTHHPPRGTICPLFIHPLNPSRLVPSFQNLHGGDFPMPPNLSSSPLSPLVHDLDDTPRHSLCVFFGFNALICKTPTPNKRHFSSQL